jgi:hypothetical protein
MRMRLRYWSPCFSGQGRSARHTGRAQNDARTARRHAQHAVAEVRREKGRHNRSGHRVALGPSITLAQPLRGRSAMPASLHDDVHRPRVGDQVDARLVWGWGFQPLASRTTWPNSMQIRALSIAPPCAGGGWVRRPPPGRASGMARDAQAFLYRPNKSAGANWTSGTLILTTTIANIATSSTQSTPKLIASDGSSLTWRSKRSWPDMAPSL